jgi:hypothetical protein
VLGSTRKRYRPQEAVQIQYGSYMAAVRCAGGQAPKEQQDLEWQQIAELCGYLPGTKGLCSCSVLQALQPDSADQVDFRDIP